MKFLEKARVQMRFWQANAVLFMDKRFKRNPRVAERLKHLRAQQEGLQLLAQNPEWRKRMPPEVEQGARYMGPFLQRLEQAIKKNPELTMSELDQIAKNPQLQEPRVRTRPGPPMKGRRRF